MAERKSRPPRRSAPPAARKGTRDGGALWSRFDAFERLARARAAGEMVALPRQLGGHDRRMHLRQTLREDHQTRIADERQEAVDKFDALAGSQYVFFRGTALLFYRDMAGEDGWLPTVLALGDVHPGNFGVMPSADNVPIFGVNDFDEAYYAPFTWDLKRGATGFMLAVEEEGGHGSKLQRAVAECFVHGYIDAMREFAASGRERSQQMRLDNAPPLVADLIENCLSTPRADWLAEDYLDEQRRGFRSSSKLVPLSSRRDEFQAHVRRYVKDNRIQVPARAADMRVKDVCARTGQGVASLGLDRYYVLIEGPNADGSDDLILEFKQARRSALAGLVPPSDFSVDGRADRVTHAQEVQLVRGDAFYGCLDIDDTSFQVRERSPFRGDIDLDELSKKDWKAYARLCGEVLAQAHARSDDIGIVDHDVDVSIIDAIGAAPLFVDDMLCFAGEAAERVRRDHRLFCADHALGAFERLDVVFR